MSPLAHYRGLHHIFLYVVFVCTVGAFFVPTPAFASVLFTSVTTGGKVITDGAVIVPEDLTNMGDSWTFRFTSDAPAIFPDGGIGVFKGTFGNTDPAYSGFGFKGWNAGSVVLSNRFLSLKSAPFGTYTVVVTKPQPGNPQNGYDWFTSGGTKGNPPLSYDTITFTYAENRTEDCCSNVFFIPGISGSDLYVQDSNDQLWPPQLFVGNYDSSELAMNSDGTSKKDIYTNEVIASAGSSHFYTQFFASLDALKETRDINEWHAQPYDWRLDIETIARGVINTKDGGTTMVHELESLAEKSQTGKVTIVAHSMGGLVGKLLIDELVRQGKEDLVDKFVTVGTPETGTPSAVGSLLHGHGQRFFFGLALSEPYARDAIHNMISAHVLLPSHEYFVHAGTSAVRILPHNQKLSTWGLAYGENISSRESLETFLTDSHDLRNTPVFDDIQTPATLHQGLLSRAQLLHDTLDAWTAPNNIEVTTVVGWGIPTIEGITYEGEPPSNNAIRYTPQLTFDGDGTVVGDSNNNVTYYFNVFGFNKLNNINIDHGMLFEAKEVASLIKNLVREENLGTMFIEKNKPSPSFIPKGTLIGVHSPISIAATNTSGQYTGKQIHTPQVVSYTEDIPNSAYLEVGDAKYVVLPTGEEYHLELAGTGSGTFSVSFDTVTQAGVTQGKNYPDIPVSTDTDAKITIAPDGTLTSFLVDTEGDGNYEKDILANTPTPTSGHRDPEAIMADITAMAPTLPISRYFQVVFLHKLYYARRYIAMDRPYTASIVINGGYKIMKKRTMGTWASPEMNAFRALYKELYESLRSRIK